MITHYCASELFAGLALCIFCFMFFAAVHLVICLLADLAEIQPAASWERCCSRKRRWVRAAPGVAARFVELLQCLSSPALLSPPMMENSSPPTR